MNDTIHPNRLPFHSLEDWCLVRQNRSEFDSRRRSMKHSGDKWIGRLDESSYEHKIGRAVMLRGIELSMFCEISKFNYGSFLQNSARNSNSMRNAVRSSSLFVHCISLRCESKFLRSVNLLGLVISPFSESRFSCGGSSCTDMTRDGSRSQEDSHLGISL